MAEVGLVAGHGGAIAAVAIGQQLVMFHCQCQGAVVDILASLGHDYCQFTGKRHVAEGGAGHDVGHRLQGNLQAVAWQSQRKDRGIGVGKGIRVTAQAAHEGRILAWSQFAAAFEQQMLQGMGQAGVAFRLVAGAYVVPQLHADQRRAVVFTQVDAQAVGEGKAVHRACRRGWGGVVGHG
ncbi:hypothetical protein D3C72_1361720 [compost metagenome]